MDASNIMGKLWKIPDQGMLPNPYFGGGSKVIGSNGVAVFKSGEGSSNKKKKENQTRSKNNSTVIPFLENDTDSVHEPSTTDESDDSLISSEIPRSSGSQRSRISKNYSRNKMEVDGEEPKTTSAIDSTVKADESVNIPGLGSPPPSTSQYTPAEIKPVDNKASTNGSINHVTSRTIDSIDLLDIDSSSLGVQPEVKTKKILIRDNMVAEGSMDHDSADRPRCIRIGCCNLATDNPDWDYEYCSAQCAVKHCKAAFFNWIETRQSENVQPVEAN